MNNIIILLVISEDLSKKKNPDTILALLQSAMMEAEDVAEVS